MQTLEEIFLTCFERPVTISFADKKGYDSLRTALLRKLRKFNDLQSSLDMPSNTFCKARWNAAERSGTFEILPISLKAERQRNLYNVIVGGPDEL